MALTKVRPPVTDISSMGFGTTVVDIPSTGADIDLDVAGLDVIDFGSTTITIDDLVTLIAKKITGESIDLATSGGATGHLETDATTLELISTGLFQTILGANSNQNLILATDGRVALDTTGNLDGQLVDKAYVDTAITGSGSIPTGKLATKGHVRFTTTVGDLIINWGQEPNIFDGGNAIVTFDLPFPNAIYTAFVTPTTSAHFDGALDITLKGLTTMNLHSSLDKTSTADWMAIGS